MRLRDRIRAAAAGARSRAVNVVRAARGVLPAVMMLAATKTPKLNYAEPQFRSSITWTPALIKAAERQADNGDMRLAGSLCEAMLADDRISGCLSETRVRGLLGLPLSFTEGTGRRKGAIDKAVEADEDWWEAFPEDALAEWMSWGILLGIGVARMSPWKTVERAGGPRVIPQLDVIHPSALRQDQKTLQLYARQDDGSEVLVTPGDGTWLVYTPYGTKRPWARGAWRSLALWWLLKEYAKGDWGRYSERHGMGLFAGIAPAEHSNAEDRDALAADLDNIARDSSVALPPGYDIKLVESVANTWTTYQAQTNMANAAFAIRLLGQNLSSEITGGSFAAAQVHARVAASIIRADDETSATTLHDQALVWWAEFNYGDRNLAPWPKRDTTPPEDKKSKAETKKTAADAVTAWVSIGAPVDVKAEAEDAGVKLIEGQKAGPPLPKQGQEQPPQPLSRAVRLASGDHVSATSGFVEGQAYADRLAANARDKASGELSPWIGQVLGIIDGLEDGPDWHEQLRARLVEAYGEGPGLEATTERAIVLAHLAGKTAVLQDL